MVGSACRRSLALLLGGEWMHGEDEVQCHWWLDLGSLGCKSRMVSSRRLHGLGGWRGDCFLLGRWCGSSGELLWTVHVRCSWEHSADAQ